MIHVEAPFIPRVGIYLKNFKQLKPDLWNCSCPVCGDISKGKQKKRMFFYRAPHANYFGVKCHHCGYSSSLGSFLKVQFPDMYKEMVFANYQETSKSHVPHNSFAKSIETVVVPMSDAQPAPAKPTAAEKKALLVDAALDKLKPCEHLADTHPVAKYLSRRLIPREQWHRLYYTLEFKRYTNSILKNKFKDVTEDHPRLVIPYLDAHGKMFAYVGRVFDKSEPRYYTMKIDDRERIYGLDRIDYSLNKIYAVEGPLDSLLIPNCIAVSGSNFDCETIRALKSVITLIPDNECRSKEIVKLVKKHIKLGYKVCMLPHSVKTKDLNDHLLSGMSSEEMVKMIDDNTFQGIAAELKFSQWKMVENDIHKTR